MLSKVYIQHGKEALVSLKNVKFDIPWIYYTSETKNLILSYQLLFRYKSIYMWLILETVRTEYEHQKGNGQAWEFSTYKILVIAPKSSKYKKIDQGVDY